MAKLNCWEFKKCGRQPGGDKVAEKGLCPAAIESRLNGLNSGRNGGRSCWAISGTLCDDQVQGSFAAKLGDCALCDFYKIVGQEEGASLATYLLILTRLK